MSRGYQISHARLRVDRNDPTLAIGYEMDLYGGVVNDISGNGIDATASGYITPAKDLFGNSLTPVAGTVSYLQNSTTGFSGPFTWSTWFCLNDKTLNNWICGSGGNSTKVGFSGGNFFVRVDPVGGAADATIPAFLGCQHVVLRRDSTDKIDLFVNGEKYRLFGDVAQPSVSTQFNRILADIGSVPESLAGKIYNWQIHYVEKSDAWVSEQYNRGRLALWKTKSVPTTGTVTSGYIGGSPFQVDSGSFKIVQDTINGEDVSAIECVTAGICWVPTSIFLQSPSGSAYGTFEVNISKSSGTTLEVLYVAETFDSPLASAQNGYYIQLSSDNRILIRKTVSGTPTTILATNAGDIVPDQYYQIEVVRSSTNVSTVFKDGVVLSNIASGTNPFTDATHIISNFVVFNIDPGDKIVLGSNSGNYSMIKRLLP